MKVAMVALGCSKNVINAEQMLYRLVEAGIELVSDPAEADLTVVNTCGFIESAKQESIDQILELCASGAKVLVSGCLAQRYGEEILAEMPEVGGIVGCGSFEDIVEAARMAAEGRTVCALGKLGQDDLSAPRVTTSPPYSAYIKIAEGCDNHCSYCVIPRLRGPFRSRTIEDIAAEAAQLAADGVKELIIVAQDITRYGLDLYGERRLPALLDTLCAIDGLHWVRLHYLYPEEIDTALISTIARQPKIVKYLDVPIQHCNDRVLASMNRRGGKAGLTSLFAELRARVPGIVLRTSVIVGFPGETQAEFDELCGFLRETGIERVGVFPYSQEEDTPAAGLPGQIPEDVKLARADIVQAVARDLMDGHNQAMRRTILEVLCEGYDQYAGLYYGRSAADSPDVDGKVFFTSKFAVKPGTFVRVYVSGAMDGDLLGRARGG